MSETVKTLLKNGTVVSGDMSVREDVLIDGEKIVKVGRNLEAEDAQVVDVNGKLLFPGFIDGHTHFDLEVAGTVTADDFETGTRAAIAGGTTLVIDYASQDKGGHTLREGLEKWHEKADGKCSCDYSFHMSIVEWNEETQREIQDMINEGITSFKLYMTYPAMIVDDGDLYKIIKKLNERKKPVIFVLWGRDAKAKKEFITNPIHYILEASHPSPLSCNYGFFGCKHFSKINRILISSSEKPIDWSLN